MSKHYERYFFLVVAVWTLAAYWFRLGGEWNLWFRTVLYAGIPTVAAVMALVAVRRYGWGNAFVVGPALIAAGLACWAVGELLWVYFESFLKVEAFPSVADYFYLAGYPLFLWAIVRAFRFAEVDWKTFDRRLLFLFGLCALFCGVLVAYFGAYRAYQPDVSLLENEVAIAYAVGDFFLVSMNLFVLLLVWGYRGGEWMRFWLMLFMAFMLALVADIGFAINHVSYEAANWWWVNALDTLWIFSYLHFGLAMWHFWETISHIQDRMRSN